MNFTSTLRDGELTSVMDSFHIEPFPRAHSRPLRLFSNFIFLAYQREGTCNLRAANYWMTLLKQVWPGYQQMLMPAQQITVISASQKLHLEFSFSLAGLVFLRGGPCCSRLVSVTGNLVTCYPRFCPSSLLGLLILLTPYPLSTLTYS